MFPSPFQAQAPSPSFSFPNPFASNPLDQAKDAAQSADRTAKDTAKSALGSNPLNKAKDVAQSADRTAKDTAKSAFGSNPLQKVKNIAQSADSEAKSAAKDADRSAKNIFGLPSNPLAGLGDKVQGNAEQAKGGLKEAVGSVTGSNPVAGGKNILGQAVDKVQGNAEQVNSFVFIRDLVLLQRPVNCALDCHVNVKVFLVEVTKFERGYVLQVRILERPSKSKSGVWEVCSKVFFRLAQ